MFKKLILLLVLNLLCGCLSYQDLQEMKLAENKPEARENLIELLEVLEEPCESPNLFAHVMETAAYLRSGLVLEKALDERYENAFYQIIRFFDLSESDEWEVADVGVERDYLQDLALQLALQENKNKESVLSLKKYFNYRADFSKKQWLIFSKAVERNKETLKGDLNFCNNYINSLFITKHFFTALEKQFFARQMDYLLNEKSAYLLGSFLKIYRPDKNCLNSLFEYAYKNGFTFDGHYKEEDFLRDLADFKLVDKYQISLRNGLYLKHLNFRKMNTLVSKGFNENILKLNEQLLNYSINNNFEWNKTAYQKNISMLIKKSRYTSDLGRKTKASLIRLAPGLYALSLTKLIQDSNSFEDVISLYKLTLKHKKAFFELSHSYAFGGQKFINPYFIYKHQKDAEQLLKEYIFKSFLSFSTVFLDSEFSSLNLRKLTIALQAYKLAGMDAFEGEYNQIKRFEAFFSKRKKEIDHKLIPYMLNIDERESLNVYLDYLAKAEFKDFQLETFVQLYEKSASSNKSALKEKFLSLLMRLVKKGNDETSLNAVKLVYRLDFLDEALSKTISIRWPDLKALRKGQ